METQEDTFSLLSVTVRVTLLAPLSAQVKAFLLATILAIPHASFDPLLILLSVILHYYFPSTG